MTSFDRNHRFESHRLIAGGHWQTIIGSYAWRSREYSARQWQVPLPDGDRIVLHDDLPGDDQPARPITVMMVHGLAGCHGSGYMQRIADRLVRRGVRVFRMDLRCCGAGAVVARQTVHAGRSLDLFLAAKFVREQVPQGELVLVGFSLGASISLRMASEELLSASEPIIDRIFAVSPPIDLASCCENLSRGWNRLYDRYFARRLVRSVRENKLLVAANACLATAAPPKTVQQFDELITAPTGGFDSAADYYETCSVKPHLHKIRVPTVILTASDDPIVPAETFDQVASANKLVELQMTEGGGHLGFLASAKTSDADWHWMDWRIIDFVIGR